MNFSYNWVIRACFPFSARYKVSQGISQGYSPAINHVAPQFLIL